MVTTLVQNGPSSNRIDIIIAGDGYTASEITTTFHSHAGALSSYMFSGETLTQPFGRYQQFFNVHTVDIVSNESGADDPGLGIYKDTALDASYYFDGVTERLLYVNTTAADAAISNALSDTGITQDMSYVTVNSDKYGGGGGTYAVYAGGNAFALDVALHEVGHSFANLADEYGGFPGPYTGGEPWEANVTTDPSGSKWSQWIGYEQEGIGTIGVYEGGQYYDSGMYRPSESSKMRDLNQPFDAVSREQFVLNFYAFVRPLDSYSTVSASDARMTSLSASPVDSSVIQMQWSVGGAVVQTSGTSLDLLSLGLDYGSYEVSLRAYDDTDWVRSDRSWLEQDVNWTVTVPRLTGSDANDTVGGTTADETIVGGAGTDTLTLLGARSNYTVSEGVGTVAISDGGLGLDGTDTVSQVEHYQFTDGTYQLSQLLGVSDVAEGVYRFYNPSTGAHFYTGSTTERDTVINTIDAFNYDGPTFASAPSTDAETSAVYRFYNAQTGAHFFTNSEEERDRTIAELPAYGYEGVAYYAYANQGTSTQALYRFYNTETGTHFYTPSEAERDTVIETLPHYTYEGQAFWVGII